MYFFFLQCSAISLIFRSKKSEDSRVDIFKDIADGTLIIHNITNNNTADLDDERRKEFARSLSEISAQPTTPFNLMILLNFQSAILAGILFDYQRVNSLYKVEVIIDELAWAYSKSLFGGSFVNIAPFESDDLSLYLFYLFIYKKSVRLGNTPNLLSSSLNPDIFISLLESSSKTRTQAETFVKIFRHSKPDIKCDCLIQFFELCEAFISSCNYCVSEGWLESIIQKYSKKENLNIKLLKDQIADFTQCVKILKKQLGDVRNEILVWEALPQYVKVDIDDVKGSDESTMPNPSIQDIKPELGGNESAGLTSTLASENKGPIESETDRVKC
ncbi:uncharacterized protein VICG_01927 [Vittaforma corneae ATCC 50505]|uniref:Uncharacterized protein n=1 Tax=Vittaforma corneae (strain ATCC 50505) TaxID=993615 RepID=L2GKL3_VITCO|nr:uncharacterized protein VICG_01927 [Vittaforma corneae ATCC 50505]ELA41045.1 hypothetical protein VICG_01927 [Vittaforma corneae ATCC 50505]